MKQKLIELLRNVPPTRTEYFGGRKQGRSYTILSDVADHLLKNGVFIAPCNVGDRVYIVGEYTRQIVYDIVSRILFFDDGCSLLLKCGAVVVKEQLGKTVFFSEEAAESALAKLKGADNERTDEADAE